MPILKAPSNLFWIAV